MLRVRPALLFNLAVVIGGSPLAAGRAWAEEPAKELRAVDRQPLALCVYYPQKKGRYVSSTDILKFVGSAAGTTTDLEPVSLTDAEVSECAALTTPVKCFVERIDATRRARAANLPPSADAATTKRGDLLLVVAARPSTEGDDELVSAALIDVGVAIELADNMSNRSPDEVEAKILERALLARPEPAKVASSDDAQQFMVRLFEKDFRAPLEKTNHWQPYGTVDIRSNVGPMSVIINDTIQAGVTAPKGITRVRGVRLGMTKVGLGGNDDVLPWEQVVEVKPNEIALLEPTFVPAPSGLASATNVAVELVGAGTFALGTGFVIYSLIASGNVAGKEICFSGTGGCRDDPVWTRFGVKTSGADIAIDQSPNGSGPPIAPLGLGLMGGGLVMGLGTLLFGEVDSFPWIQVAAGVVLGFATYFTLAALDNKGNFDP